MTGPVAPEVARSWLLVPGHSPDLFDAAAHSPADAVVLDTDAPALFGLTHLTSVLTLWLPVYPFEAGLRVLTGVVGVVAAWVLWPLIPNVCTRGRSWLLRMRTMVGSLG